MMNHSHIIYRCERALIRRIRKLYIVLLSFWGFPGIQGKQLQLQSIQNKEKRLVRAKEFSAQQPHRPEWRREVMNLTFWTDAGGSWERFQDYHQIRQAWLKKTGLGQMKLEFVPSAMAVGSLGQFRKMEFLVRSKELGLRDDTQLMMLLPPNPPLRNPALFRYIRPYLEVVEDEEICQALQPLEDHLILPMEIVLPLRNGCPHEVVAGNLIEQEWAAQGRGAWLTLADDHREQGQKILNDLGIPQDAWYVTLHMREKGYRDAHTTSADLRNVDPMTYFEAIQCITDAGGWVFRMGDPVSMTPLPNLPQVIDYAHSSIRSDWMDVFLGATSRFCLATSSGYYVIPKAFGVPVLLTNSVQSVCYYGLSRKDIFLPCRMWEKHGKEPLRWEDYFSPQISCGNDINFFNSTVQFQPNTSYELAEATREMLLHLEPTPLPASHPLQERMQQAIQKAGLMYGGFEIRPLASIASVFLEQANHSREHSREV